jgi:hypothetical protein
MRNKKEKGERAGMHMSDLALEQLIKQASNPKPET